MPDEAAEIIAQYEERLIQEKVITKPFTATQIQGVFSKNTLSKKVNSTNLYVGQNLPVKHQISLHRTTLVMGGKHIKDKYTILLTEKRMDGGSSFGITGAPDDKEGDP